MGAIFHAAFFVTLQPTIIYFLVFTLIGFYWYNKYMVLKACKIPEMTDYLIFENAIASSNDNSFERPFFGTVKNPINMMNAEHETAGDETKQLRILSNDYTPPEDGCNTYRVAFKKLEEFENDLFKHVHLENNILFPKIIELESKLIK